MRKTILFLLFSSLCLCSCDKDEEPLSITSFEPVSGDYDTEVHIQVKPSVSADVTVTFGTATAEIVSVLPAEIVVKVPFLANGNITVTDKSRKATAATAFAVTGGTWTKKSDFSRPVADSWAELFFSIGNKAYVHKSNRNGSSDPAELWMFDPAANTWVQKKELSTDLGNFSATAFGTADKGYVLQYQKLWEYDPTANSWTQKKALPVALNTVDVIAAFYVESSNRVVAVMRNGEWFVYDPVNDTWGRNLNAPFTSSLSSTVSYYPHGQGADTKGYLKIGKEVWQYSANEWTKLPEFPGMTESNYSFGLGDDLYLGLSRENNLWVYKAAQNTWIRKAGVAGTLRDAPIYFSLGDKGYFGLGLKMPEEYFVKDFYEYTPQ
jgi:hypothetical protein